MVNDSEAVVTARLLADPELATAASHAADAYVSRKHSGKALAITGGVVLGVTDIGGAVLMFTAQGYPNVYGNGVGQFLAGLAVGVVGQVVGFSLLIPGVVRLSTKTNEEKMGIDQYLTSTPPAPPPSTAPRPVPPTSGAITLPLFSASF